MLSELTVKEFLTRVRSGDPVPGGGSVAALAAALSGALCAMVAHLTVGKTGDAALDEKMSTLAARAMELEAKLTEDIDRDSLAYGAVLAAFRLAKGTDDEKAARLKAVQEAFVGAARVPLSVAEGGVELLSLAGAVVKDGNANAVTDGAVGAMMARAAVFGAVYNVRINLSSIKDGALVAEMARAADALEKKATDMEREILALARSAMEKQV